MSLRRKVAGGVVLLVAAIVTVSAASLWAINSLRQDLGFAVEENERLQRMYWIASHLTTARRLLNLSPPQRGFAAAELGTALQRLELLSGIPEARKAPLQAGAHAALAALTAGPLTEAEDKQRLQLLNDAIGQFRNFADESRTAIADRQRAADVRRRLTLITLAILGAAMTLAAAFIGWRQYRSVARPLKRLGDAARRIATGQFQQRLPEDGDEEVVELSRDFNRMAAELEETYRNLEHTVQAKSRQLVQSERLAGVGYLAAGMAHEINNPLSIIAGHAEMTLNRLKRDAAAPAEPRTLEALKLIAEETFRCKGIIQKLLALTGGRGRGPARGEGDEPAEVDLAALATGMVQMLHDLAPYWERRMDVRVDGVGPWLVRGSDAELRQVLLNLVVNAAESTAEGGEIRVGLRRRDSTIELSVTDNGRGMSPETLARIFEPFFSLRPPGADRDAPGTGLGLSISHAIVENHGGRIWASSDGPGTGSRFTIELPAQPGGGNT